MRAVGLVLAGLLLSFVQPSGLVRAQVASAGGLPSDIQLPSDTSIKAPDADVPKETAAFSGIWTGNWGGKLNGVVIVREIKPDGTASIIYAWGNAPDWNVRSGYRPLDGQIKSGVLAISIGRADVTYRLQADGTLAGSYLNGRGYKTPGTFRHPQ